jgi:hypothetical protein
MRFSMPCAQKAQTMPLTVTLTVFAAIDEVAAMPIKSAMMMFFIEILLIKYVHEIHSGLGCVAHPEFDEIALIYQAQHWRYFGLIR